MAIPDVTRGFTLPPSPFQRHKEHLEFSGGRGRSKPEPDRKPTGKNVLQITEKQRKEIVASALTARELAHKYNISMSSVYRMRREDPNERRHYVLAITDEQRVEIATSALTARQLAREWGTTKRTIHRIRSQHRKHNHTKGGL